MWYKCNSGYNALRCGGLRAAGGGRRTLAGGGRRTLSGGGRRTGPAGATLQGGICACAMGEGGYRGDPIGEAGMLISIPVLRMNTGTMCIYARKQLQ
jgi:hypothetical protein